MRYDNPLRGSSRGGAQGGNFRARHGVLYAQVLNNAKIPRDMRGMMLPYLQGINEKLAVELQELVAAKLESSRVPSRRGVSSGRLKGAILDPKNRMVTPFVMGVGRMDWLDKSQAKYWRGIEVGTDQFVGNFIKAGWLWGGSLSGHYGGTSRFGPYPLADQPFSRSMPGRGDGRVRPMSKATAYRFLAAQGMRKRDAYMTVRSMKPVEIKRAIHAHWMFREAWREFDAEAKGRAALREAMYHMGLLGPR